MKLLVIVFGVCVEMACGASLPVHQESVARTELSRLLEAVTVNPRKVATTKDITQDATNRSKRQSVGSAYAGYGTYETHQYGKFQYAGYGVAPSGIPNGLGSTPTEATSEKGGSEKKKDEKHDENDCDEHDHGFGYGGHGFGHGGFGFGHGGHGFGHGGHRFGHGGYGIGGYGYGGYGYGYGQGFGQGYGQGYSQGYGQGYALPIIGNIQVGLGGYGGYFSYGG